MAKLLRIESPERVVEALLGLGKRVVAPVKDGELHRFLQVERADEADFRYFQSEGSMKGLFLPATEGILRFSLAEKEPKIEEPDLQLPETFIVGCRPCDAAALPIQDKVFTWDYVDEFYKARRDAATVVSLACSHTDNNCFCTSVGLAPDSPEGSDILMVKTERGFVADVATEKGEKLASLLGLREKADNEERNDAGGKARNLITRKFESGNIPEWLGSNFEDPLWERMCGTCIGCAVCTFICPTCHCFDIVDEPVGTSGDRRKNWDACTLWHFTVHASGHNPRDVQYKRYRQRIMHKFNYYPDMFGKFLCTGCGRCIRACPVGLDMAEVLEEISSRA
ncbi:MAG: 4Fe-4S dicluster domain-containing protein [bacterium]